MDADFNQEIIQHVRESLSGWLSKGKGTPSEYRIGMVLTPDAEAERNGFEREFDGDGCRCFICDPCGYCIHPGNPMNQEETDECWMPAFKFC